MASSAGASALVEKYFELHLPTLEIDAESYSNYAAEVVCDGSLPWQERRETLREMFSIIIDDTAALTDKDTAAEALSSLLDAAYDTFHEALNAAKAAELEQATRAAAELEKNQAAAIAAAEISAASNHAVDTELPSEMKRLIMANYGYEYEDEDTPSSAESATAKRKAEAKTAAATDAKRAAASAKHSPSGSGLDSALGELAEMDKSGGDTKGLGRRARRAIEREAGGAGVQRSSASPLSTSDATADAASPSGVTRHSDSVGGSGGEADAPAAAPARAVPANRSLVTYDPMEIQLGNKAYKLATERDLRDAARAKVEAENQRVREADEAARAARELAKQKALLASATTRR